MKIDLWMKDWNVKNGSAEWKRSSIRTVAPPSRKSCILAKMPLGISNSVQMTFGVCVRVCVWVSFPTIYLLPSYFTSFCTEKGQSSKMTLHDCLCSTLRHIWINYSYLHWKGDHYEPCLSFFPHNCSHILFYFPQILNCITAVDIIYSIPECLTDTNAKIHVCLSPVNLVTSRTRLYSHSPSTHGTICSPVNML